MISWGANSYGQLGQGFCSEQCLSPQPIDSLDSLDPASVIQIDGGARHTLILDKHGTIWTCGLENKENSSVFKPIIEYENIKYVQIACGWDFSAAISATKELYVWGSNNFGQLGFSKEQTKFLNKPTKVGEFKVEYVACGLRHMAIITSDNKLQVSGSNVNGQLGINIKKDVDRFQEVTNLIDIKMVACGQKHTVALTNTDEFYVWGDNKWGQLGVNPTTLVATKTPIKLDFSQIDKPIQQLHCGWTHNAVLTKMGDVWTWGRNNYGQLGHSCENNWQPQKLQLRNVSDVAVGAEHNLAVSENKIYSWGWNEHGNCGNGSQNNIFEPVVIFSNKLNRNIYCIGCGTGQSLAAVK